MTQDKRTERKVRLGFWQFFQMAHELDDELCSGEHFGADFMSNIYMGASIKMIVKTEVTRISYVSHIYIYHSINGDRR